YASSATWRSAVDEGVATGRAGKGAIYTWAAGNGGTIEDFGGGILFPFDNSNNDGQANYYAVLAIAALADDGSRASYSEEGANLMVAAPAGEFCDTHTTTTVDRSGANGYNTGGDFVGNGKSDYADANYTKCFNGTSSATPVATGAIALMLEANPNLSWRDVRIILARSARKNDATDTDWTTNGAGLNVNHKYGYGALDTAAAVTMAKGWATVGGSNSMVTRSSTSSPAALIPDNGAGDIFQYGTPLSNTITLSNSGISNIEFVEITVDSDHTYSSDLEIEITSPNGTISKLAKTRRCNDGTSFVNCGAQYSGGWRFGSARHIDESADGTWTLTVTDGWYAASGYLNSWQLKIYGH
ncbi:MAG: proprotein convertase P-domain-containing protein, partial [Gammaproteobacteria bacterium]|nr:proprotein convertase P-domain-containing protein [Gammaproteobacteria bacterium]